MKFEEELSNPLTLLKCKTTSINIEGADIYVKS